MPDGLTILGAFKHISARTVIIQGCAVCTFAANYNIRRNFHRANVIIAIGEVDDAALRFRCACCCNRSVNSFRIVFCIRAICAIVGDIKYIVPCKITHPRNADI